MTPGKRRTRVEHGLHIVRKINAAKATLWYVYAYRGGPQIYTCEGAKPKITPTILEEATEVRRERHTVPRNTLAGLVEAYRASPEFEKLQPRTRKDYEIELDKILAKFGSVPLPVFNERPMREDVTNWRNEISDRPRTADKRIVMLATVLAYGVQLGRLSINIAAGIPALYKADRSEEIWKKTDWEAILPHCSKELTQVLKLASLTGLRLGDLVTLEWVQVGQNAIIKTTRKKNRRVVIPILPELSELLNAIGRGAGTVLKNSRDQAWTENGLGTVFQRAKVKAGIGVRIHDLRGTYATWLAIQGLTDQEIGRIVAWSEKQVAALRMRYISEEHVVASLVNRLAKKA